MSEEELQTRENGDIAGDFNELPCVDERIEDLNGFRGTVRYVGKVHAAKNREAIWVGVEFDDKLRGKHDGSLTDKGGETKRYFTCENGCGAFIKPDSFWRGTTFVEALESRYEKPEENRPSGDVEVAGEVSTLAGTKAIELIGSNKIKRQQSLKYIDTVTLEYQRISRAGASGAIKSAAPYIKNLNLQLNLFNSWEEIFLIAKELDILTLLDVSGNKLTHPPKNVPDNTFATLEVLNVNRTTISWDSVLLLERHMPKLRELLLAENKLNSFKLPNGTTKAFQSLAVLDLSKNYIDTWESIAVFGSLPVLETLVLNDNEIDKIPLRNSESFVKLSTLMISSNKISSFASIDALNGFSDLRTLRVQGNPVFQGMGVGESRLNVIARVATITGLNGSDILPRERIDCERLFLRRIAREVLTFYSSHAGSEESKAKVLEAYPRYDELVAKYGKPEIVASVEQVGALSNETAETTMVSMAPDSMTAAPVKRKLLLRMTVLQVKQMLARRFKLPTERQKLFYRKDKSDFPLPMDDEEMELRFYGLQDGGEILMEDSSE